MAARRGRGGEDEDGLQDKGQELAGLAVGDGEAHVADCLDCLGGDDKLVVAPHPRGFSIIRLIGRGLGRKVFPTYRCMRG